MRSGISKSEIIKSLLKSGKTVEMEVQEIKSKMADILTDSSFSIEEKVNFLKDTLSTEAKFLMEELLKQGYCREEILELFARCANDITSVNSDAMFKKKVRFSDEPPDAYLYEVGVN